MDPMTSAVDLGQALTVAVESNDLAHASELLANGAQVNRKNALGLTPLMVAAGRGCIQMVELLLTAGADLHLLDSRVGSSALHKAAQSGVSEIALLLLRHGAFIDLQTALIGHTALMDAVWMKHLEMTRLLLSQGANVNLRNHYGATVFDFVATGNSAAPTTADSEDQRTLLRHISDLLDERKRADDRAVERQEVMTAVRNNDLDAVQRHIAAGADVNTSSPVVGGPDDGHTPLLVASREGNAEIVRCLLASGANARIPDFFMRATPGHKAAYMGHAEVLSSLLDDGLELNAQGPYNGYTALHDAVWHGHSAAVTVLLDSGARSDLRGHNGKTPLELAVQYGYTEIVELIRAYFVRRSSSFNGPD
jgi:ankyrin repeat protein